MSETVTCTLCNDTKVLRYEETKSESIIEAPCPKCVKLSSCRKEHELISFYYGQCPMCMLLEAIKTTQDTIDENMRRFYTLKQINDRVQAYIRR